MKSDKMLYITYVDIESLIKKPDRCANNPEYSLWVFNVNNLGISSYRKQAYFIL